MQSLSISPAATRAVRFDVTAASGSGLLSAVLAPFACRGLIPDAMRARRKGETMRVEIVVNDMPDGLVAGCEASLRRLVDVLRVGVAPIVPTGPGPMPVA